MPGRSLLAALPDRVANLLYEGKENAFYIIKILSRLNILYSAGLLVYRYGFVLNAEEVAFFFRNITINFLIFALIFFARMLFSTRRMEFVRASRGEAVLVGLVLLHGVARYFFDFNFFYALANRTGLADHSRGYEHFISLYMLLFIGLEVAKYSIRVSSLRVKPAQMFIASFLLLIGGGAFLLMLPAMSTQPISFLDALFMSASASCVTGLAVVDTGTFFTLKGQLVLLFLMQIGGLGMMTFATFFASFLTSGVGLRQQSLMQDVLSSDSLISAKNLLRRTILIMLGIEGAGAVLIYFSWSDDLVFDSPLQKVYFSVFHSISAFCNAGFSLFSGGLYTSEIPGETDAFGVLNTVVNIRDMYGLHFSVALLIVLGGLGFGVIEDLFSRSALRERRQYPWKRLKVSTKMALYPTILLLAMGTIGFMFLEFSQLRNRTILEALLTSFFQSVTTRTAGFNTLDFGSLSTATIILCIFLMFIGASPGSTGGGIKTTTFYVILLASVASIRGRDRVEFERRTIPFQTIQKGLSIFIFAATYNIFAIFMLSIAEQDSGINILHIVFEQISAFATVGLSMGITADLSPFSKSIIILTMYIGRVGTLTLALALSSKVRTNSYVYPDTHVMVG